MNTKLSIKVFEHQHLKVDENGFTEDHFNRLVYYNELHGSKYFIIGYKKIKFTNYVGIIQVGNLTIEILPKADNTSDYGKWTAALLTMLYYCKKISLRSISEAYVKLRSTSILDLIFESFLYEVEILLNHGIIKGYRFNQANLTALKGKIIFSEHLNRNITHKEFFFARYEKYDYNIIWNQILKKALQIINTSSQNASLKNKTSRLLWFFDTIDNTAIGMKTFEKLRYTRKTEYYKKAIKLSELIILSHSPDIKHDRNFVLGILFDMNQLFEEYIYRILKKEEVSFSDNYLEIKAQQKKPFWANRKIKPDLLITYEKENLKRIIIDTKWKILNDYQPSDDDLRQMYAYNIHFDAAKSVLLYPRVNQFNQDAVAYAESDSVTKEHACQLVFADLFDNEGKAKDDAGKNLLRYIIESENVRHT